LTDTKKKQFAFVSAFACLLFWSLAASLLHSADQTYKQRDFGFGSMEMSQFEYGTSNLVVQDMNGDGLEDLLFLNNNISRLEILIRRAPDAADQTTKDLAVQAVNKGFVLDQWSDAFQVADINGDKRPDIVSIGKQLGILLHIQLADGSFVAGDPLFLKDPADQPVNHRVVDLNSDSYVDILICRKNSAEILWNDGSGVFKKNSHLEFSSAGCRAGFVADINNDGLQDLLFLFENGGAGGASLHVRLGDGHGQFGWEQTLLLPSLRALKTVRLENDSQLAVILKNKLILRLYAFVQKPRQNLLNGAVMTTNRLPLPGMGGKDAPTWVSADFNKDGYSDFCTAAPMLSQIHLYMGGPDGLQAVPRQFDSLTSIKTMKRTQRGDLIVFSPSEKAIGLHPHKTPAKFPVLFKAEGKPTAMTVGPADAVFAIYKDKNFSLKRFKPGKDVDKSDAPILAVQTHELDITNGPQDIRVFPLPGKDHCLVMLFMAYEPPVALRLEGETLTRLQPEQFRALSLNLEADAVVSAGEKGGILVCEGLVARLYQWQGEKFSVTRQLNPGRKTARLTAACRFGFPKGKNGFLIYDEAGQDLIWFADVGPKTPVRFVGGLKDIVGLESLQFKEKSGLLIVGKSDVQWLLEEQKSLSLQVRGEYASQTEAPDLWSISAVTVGSPGRKMLALLDSKNRAVELVARQEQKLVEQLVFEIFQDPGFREAAPGYEPHQVESGDFNGDKIYDLAILVHNKLIIYLGH